MRNPDNTPEPPYIRMIPLVPNDQHWNDIATVINEDAVMRASTSVK